MPTFLRIHVHFNFNLKFICHSPDMAKHQRLLLHLLFASRNQSIRRHFTVSRDASIVSAELSEIIFFASIVLNFFLQFHLHPSTFDWNYNAKQIWRIRFDCRMQRKLYIFEKYTFLHEYWNQSRPVQNPQYHHQVFWNAWSVLQQRTSITKNQTSTGTEIKSYWIEFGLGRLIHQNRLYWRFVD